MQFRAWTIVITRFHSCCSERQLSAHRVHKPASTSTLTFVPSFCASFPTTEVTNSLVLQTKLLIEWLLCEILRKITTFWSLFWCSYLFIIVSKQGRFCLRDRCALAACRHSSGHSFLKWHRKWVCAQTRWRARRLRAQRSRLLCEETLRRVASRVTASRSSAIELHWRRSLSQCHKSSPQKSKCWNVCKCICQRIESSLSFPPLLKCDCR